jgi:hypothetical protein
MFQSVSWWLLAVVVGASAPLWVRALVNRWERRATQRTERVLAQLERDPEQNQGTEINTDAS